MDVLLDCVEYNPCDRIFAIVHLVTKEISIISPSGYDDFKYLGLDDWSMLAIAGDSVLVTDDMGEEHRIVRIE